MAAAGVVRMIPAEAVALVAVALTMADPEAVPVAKETVAAALLTLGPSPVQVAVAEDAMGAGATRPTLGTLAAAYAATAAPVLNG